MKVIETRILRGPNVYAFLPCIKLVIDLEELTDLPATKLRRIKERLSQLLPSFRRQLDRPLLTGAMDGSLRECASIADIVEYLVLDLQRLAGSRVDFGKTRQVGEGGRYAEVVCGYVVEPLAEQVCEFAVELAASVAAGAPIDVDAAVGRLQALITLCAAGSTAVSAAGGAVAVVDKAALSPRRIPIIAVTGTNGKTTTTLLIASGFRTAGRVTGVATTEGIFIDSRVIEHGDCSGYWSARTILGAAEVEVAVLETARGGILKRGLGFDHCDVAVILNVSDDHLGQDGIDSIEDMARVKSLVAQTATAAVVLNAEDGHCVAMARQVAPGVEILYFSCDEDHPVLRSHLQGNGRAVYLHGDEIILADSAGTHSLFRADSLAVTLYGRARHNVANTLAAVAALVAQGQCSHEAILSGMRSFSCSTEKNPLRLNIFSLAGVTVWVDYAHNPAAYRAILHTARAMRFTRIVGVVSAPADRRDAELQEIGRVCAGQLDAMVVYEPDEIRGRPPGETARVLFESAVAANAVATAAGTKRVHEVPDVRKAIWTAYTLCTPGDLLLFGGATNIQDLKTALTYASPAPPLVLEERLEAEDA